MMSSDFPQSWKEAEVIPLIKEGDHEIPRILLHGDHEHTG